MGPDVQQTHYKGFPKYEDNVPVYISTLTNLCPEAVEDHSLTIVSDLIFKEIQTQKVQALLNRLMATNVAQDQLVLVIAIRKTISGVDEPPVT